MSLNIFSSLARYADRQTENFLTESFVYLLNLLVEREKVVSGDILRRLCGQKSDLWFLSPTTVLITTHLTITTGRPDIVIVVDNTKIAFIEVKHNSPLGPAQLERYTDHLNLTKHTEKQMVLLTRSRHSIRETTLAREAFHHVCWYEISGWLSEAKMVDSTAKHIAKQFLEFLHEKEMTMEKVNWEYIEGVPAMIRLVNMLRTAFTEASPKEKWKQSAGASWTGYYVGNNFSIFLGFRYNNPLVIRFEDDRGNNPSFIRELSLETSHFFSLSAGEQLECLIRFIRHAQADYMNEKPEQTDFIEAVENPSASTIAQAKLE
jgi:hypothetical protein